MTKTEDHLLRRDTWNRIWEAAYKLLLPAVIFLGATMIANELRDKDQDYRLDSLESWRDTGARFTHQDGETLRLRVSVLEQKVEFHQAGEHVQASLWLREDMTEIKSRLKDIEQRMRVLESR